MKIQKGIIYLTPVHSESRPTLEPRLQEFGNDEIPEPRRVGWGDSLRQLVTVHPIDVHRAAAIRPNISSDRDEPAGFVVRLPAALRASRFDFMQALRVSWFRQKQIGLEQAVAIDTKAVEHRAAEPYRAQEWCSGDVLDDEWAAGRYQQTSRLRNEICVISFVYSTQSGVRLTGRARVDCVELAAVRGEVFERVALNEGERIPRLRPDVHAHNLEAGAGVAHCRTASAAIQIQQPHVTWLSRSSRLGASASAPVSMSVSADTRGLG